MEKEQDLKPKQKRYYSLKELVRKYSIYLKNKIAVINLHEADRDFISLKEYFQWLKRRSLTLYTVGEQKLREYYEWFCSVQNPITQTHSITTLQRRKRGVYRFYSWAYCEGILEENPFTPALLKEATNRISKIDRPPPSFVRQISESFQEAWALAEKMEAQRNYNSKTVYIHQVGWRTFFHWLEWQKIKDIRQVTERELIDYQDWLIQHEEEETGHRFNALKRLRLLIAVKALFGYLRKGLYLEHDPTHVIELPQCGKGIPHVLMSRHEVEKLLSLPDLTIPMGLRDRTIMEVFYSTGMRLNELCHLKIEDILFQEGLVRVMVPKGGVQYQRVVAIGQSALEFIRKYLSEVRSELVSKNQHEYLFINSYGKPLHKQNLVTVMRNYRLKGGFKKQISSHSFRVTAGTEMLRNGADIRHVQEQLGHAVLQTTQIYTRILPTDLKKVHSKTHPGERRRRGLDSV